MTRSRPPKCPNGRGCGVCREHPFEAEREDIRDKLAAKDVEEAVVEHEQRCPCGEVNRHPEDHPDECCDCFDLGCGMPLAQLNVERVRDGKKPLLARHKVAP